jgi:hypothetical protein
MQLETTLSLDTPSTILDALCEAVNLRVISAEVFHVYPTPAMGYVCATVWGAARVGDYANVIVETEPGYGELDYSALHPWYLFEGLYISPTGDLPQGAVLHHFTVKRTQQS